MQRTEAGAAGAEGEGVLATQMPCRSRRSGA